MISLSTLGKQQRPLLLTIQKILKLKRILKALSSLNRVEWLARWPLTARRMDSIGPELCPCTFVFDGRHVLPKNLTTFKALFLFEMKWKTFLYILFNLCYKNSKSFVFIKFWIIAFIDKARFNIAYTSLLSSERGPPLKDLPIYMD